MYVNVPYELNNSTVSILNLNSVVNKKVLLFLRNRHRHIEGWLYLQLDLRWFRKKTNDNKCVCMCVNVLMCVFVQLLSHLQLFATHGLQYSRLPCLLTISWSWLRLMSIESVMPSNHFNSVLSFSFCPQSFPAAGAFPMSQLFTSGIQSIGASASASVLAMNIQGWFL